MFSNVLKFKIFPLIKMSMLRFLFCIRDEHETLVATLDMWKFRVVTLMLLGDTPIPLRGYGRVHPMAGGRSLCFA